MAATRVSHKRSYDDFIAPYAAFGYNAHAGRNVEVRAPESMDIMEEVVPLNKRSKYAFHDDESAQISTPSTQARLAAKAIETFPTLASTEDCTCPFSVFVVDASFYGFLCPSSRLIRAVPRQTPLYWCCIDFRDRGSLRQRPGEAPRLNSVTKTPFVGL